MWLNSDGASILTADDVLDRLQSNVRTGLTNIEAYARLKFHGYNEFSVSEEEPIWKKYLEQVFCFKFLSRSSLS